MSDYFGLVFRVENVSIYLALRRANANSIIPSEFSFTLVKDLYVAFHDHNIFDKDPRAFFSILYLISYQGLKGKLHDEARWF